jgi:transposase
MSDDYQRIELITGTAWRRRWTTEQKLRIIEASYVPGESVSSVARQLQEFKKMQRQRSEKALAAADEDGRT